VSTKTLAVDSGLAIALAALALIVSPGVAVSAIIGILGLAVCAISVAFDRRAARPRPGVSVRRGQRGREDRSV
jgi:Flp pilus assembly protein TadB